MTLRNFHKIIDSAVYERLQIFGFEVAASGILLYPIRPDWDGWVGLNHRTGAKSYELNPVIGVRSAILERLIARLSETPYSRSTPPSLSTTLRFLMSNPVSRWVFAEGADYSEMLDDVVDSIVQVGVSYMENSSNLEAIAESLAPGDPDAKGTPVRYPVVLVMLNQSERAVRYVDKQLDSLSGDTVKGGYSESYRSFAIRFLKFVEHVNRRKFEDVALDSLTLE